MANKYVRTSGGNDANSGNSFGAAWATVQHAANNISSGDTLFLSSVGSPNKFTPASAITITLAPSTLGTIWVGAGSSGTVDGTIVEIDGTSTAAGTDTLTLKSGDPFGSDANYIFRNIRITNSKRDCWRIGDYDGTSTFNIVGDVVLINCHASNAGAKGFYGTIGTSGQNNPFNVNFVNCTSTNNASDGFRMEGTAINYYACWSGNNTGNGFISDCGVSSSPCTVNNHNVAAATYSHCIASNNTTGFEYFRSMINCVSYSNTDGCRTPRTFVANVRGQNGIFPVINCIFENNTFGINNNWNTDCQPVALIHSVFYNNTTDINDIGKIAVQINKIDIGTSPFINAVGNDFRLNNISGSGKRCRNNAYPRGMLLDGIHINWKDIGAIPSKKPKIVTVT